MAEQQPKTMKVVDPNGGYMIINREDFDESTMQEFVDPNESRVQEIIEEQKSNPDLAPTDPNRDITKTQGGVINEQGSISPPGQTLGEAQGGEFEEPALRTYEEKELHSMKRAEIDEVAKSHGIDVDTEKDTVKTLTTKILEKQGGTKK